jgi:hypothetical protein
MQNFGLECLQIQKVTAHQREAKGLPYANLEWVLRTYDIPQEILSKLGLRDDPDLLFRA